MQTRHRTNLLRAFVLIALSGLIAFGWGQRARFAPVASTRAAPEFSGTTLSGVPFSIANSRGKVIVLNVWATWCTPCQREMPALERLHRTLRDEGLEVVGVSVDAAVGTTDVFGQPGGDVSAFVQAFGLTFPIVRDPRKRIQSLFLVQGLPTTIIIDRRGTIVEKIVGARPWSDDDHIRYFKKLLDG